MAVVTTRYAGFWIRVVAYLIDAVILGVVGAILSGVGLHSRSVDAQSSSPSALLSLIYFGLLWSHYGGGQTLGMRLLKLRVVGTDGNQIGVVRALVRWLFLFISFVVCFIGVIWVAFDPQKQGWHDKVASTCVIAT
jgi:uncharacterized RDD family membrane protein YckC